MSQKQVKKTGENKEETFEELKPKEVETEEVLKEAEDILEKIEDRLPKKEERQKILKRKQQDGE